MTGPASFALGNTGVYSLANVSDTAGDLPSLHYSFGIQPSDLAPDYNSAGAANSFSFTPTGTGSYTIYGMVYDKDGGINTYQIAITVTGSSPVVDSSNPFVVNADAANPAGNPQRSTLTTIDVNFTSPVSVADFASIPITLTRNFATATGVTGTVVSNLATAGTNTGLISLTQLEALQHDPPHLQQRGRRQHLRRRRVRLARRRYLATADRRPAAQSTAARPTPRLPIRTTPPITFAGFTATSITWRQR